MVESIVETIAVKKSICHLL